MQEMKQLWMNPLFKQMVRWLTMVVLSGLLVYFSYDHWIQHKSWLELMGAVVLFQLVFWALVLVGKRIPWIRLATEGYQQLIDLFSNDEADEDIAVMRADLRELKKCLDVAQKKLPLLIGFESDAGQIEKALQATKVKVIPLKQTSPFVSFVLTETAVLCLCTEALRAEKGRRWTCFLRLLGKHFELFSAVVAVIWTTRQNVEQCRYQLDEMMRTWHRTIPIYGVCDALSLLSKFEGTSGGLQSCSLNSVPAAHQSTVLAQFFDGIFEKIQWARYTDLEDQKNAEQKWEKFLLPSQLKSDLFHHLYAWQTLVQHSDFHCPSMLKRLIVCDGSQTAYQSLWNQLIAQAILQTKQAGANDMTWSLARKVQLACVAAVLLVATGSLVWKGLHVRAVLQMQRELVRDMTKWGDTLAVHCKHEEGLRVALTLLNHSTEPLKVQIGQVLRWANLPQDRAVLIQEALEINQGRWPSKGLLNNPVLRSAIAMARYRLENASPISAFSAQLAMAEQSKLWGPIDLNNSLANGSRDLVLIQESIPRLYTAKGWTEFVQPLIEQFEQRAQEQDWLLAALNVNTKESNRQRLTQYYFKQYAKHWEVFFQGITLRHFLNTQDAAVKLSHLVDEDSTWASLLQFVSENLTPLAGFKTVSIGEYQEGLGQIKSEIESLLYHSDFGREIEQYVQLIFARQSDPTSGLATLSHKIKRFHKPSALGVQNAFATVLMQPLIRVYLAASKDALLQIEKDWVYQIVSPFRMNLSNKFPFQNTKQEVSLADFTVFFSPKQGKIAQFIQNRVQPLTMVHQGRLVPKQWLGTPVPLSSAFLSSAEYLLSFSQGFFSEEAAQPLVKFQLMPEPSSAFTYCSLEIDGTAYIYKNDPEEWKLLRWPGESPYPKSTFTVTMASSKTDYFETVSGEWSFFKLLKQYADCQEDSPGYYRVSFKINQIDKPMTFKIKTASATDVFKLLSMEKFELVDKVYGNS